MKRLIILLLIIVFYACVDKTKTSNVFEKKAKNVIGGSSYKEIYFNLKDSFNLWVINNLVGVEAEKIYLYDLDSLLCFNDGKDRFISCRHLYVNINDATSDDLQFVYGEKINDQWYFFKGPSIVIPRSMIKNHPINKPLSYQQLHQIALKEVYSDYLKSNGEINEAWFNRQFEGPGWVNWDDSQEKIKSYTRKDYEQFHLKVVRNNWNGLNKDSIKQLPPKNNLP
jgi:hypothetical protein